MEKNILILGNGGWGTAIALLLHRNGHRVTIWGKFPEDIERMRSARENRTFLPGVRLPSRMRFISGVDGLRERRDLYVMAIPTQFIRGTLGELRPHLDRRTPIVSVAKGIERGTDLLPTAVVREVLGSVPIAVLSGPSHAEEVGRGLPATVVIASKSPKMCASIQRLFSSGSFRTYSSGDPLGVELGGALKNVIAIAAGICDGLHLGDNAKAALLTRGIVEISRIGAALGARVDTFFGLSGIGDLMTTCYSPHGRNLYVGRQIGGGRSLKQVLKGMKMVAEGVWTIPAVLDIARRRRIDAPITTELHHILFQGKAPMRAVRRLMSRELKSESPTY